MDRVDLAAGPALRAGFRWKRSSASGAEVGLESYQLIVGGKRHAFGFLTRVEELGSRVGEWDAVMSSLRVASPTPSPSPSP